MLLASIIASGLGLASVVGAAPVRQVALSPVVVDVPQVRAECRSPHTSYICPSNVRTFPAPDGYLGCGLPESFDSHRTCLYKAFGNYEDVNYMFDGSHNPDSRSDPACERWSRALTTCARDEGDVRDICDGEQTEHSCPAGYVSEPSLNSPTDIACVSKTNTCFYYNDSGLLDVSDDGRLDTTNYRREDFDNGCPAEMDRVTMCDRVVAGPWQGFSL